MVDLASLFQNLLSGRLGGQSYNQWAGGPLPTMNGLGMMGQQPRGPVGAPVFGPDGKPLSPLAGPMQQPPMAPPNAGAFAPKPGNFLDQVNAIRNPNKMAPKGLLGSGDRGGYSGPNGSFRGF